MASQKAEDGGASSASASLLTDLLSEAKADIAAERQVLEAQQQTKAAEEAERAAREEARRREEMQRRLIEETRLRNDALARRDRSGDGRSSPSTARHQRPEPAAEGEAPMTAAGPVKAAAPAKKGMPGWLVAALVLVGAGVGVGAAILMTPKPTLTWPNVDGLAASVVEQTVKAAKATGEVAEDLAAARAKIKELQGRIAAAEQAHTTLTAQLAETTTALEAAETELEEASASSGTPTRRVRRTTRKTGDGVPQIGSDIFK